MIMHYSLLYGNHIIAEIVKGELGNVGGEKYWRCYGFHVRVDWCANECGIIDNGTVPRFACCPYGEQWFENQNSWWIVHINRYQEHILS